MLLCVQSNYLVCMIVHVREFRSVCERELNNKFCPTGPLQLSFSLFSHLQRRYRKYRKRRAKVDRCPRYFNAGPHDRSGDTWTALRRGSTFPCSSVISPVGWIARVGFLGFQSARRVPARGSMRRTDCERRTHCRHPEQL